MPGKDQTTIVHLTYDHQSTRFLCEIIGGLDGVENVWWIAPDERIGELEGHYKGRLEETEALKKVLSKTADAVVIHRLKPSMSQWFRYIPDHVPVVWATWGDDYYRKIPALSRQLFLPLTKLSNALLLKYSVALGLFMQRWSNFSAFDAAVARVDAVSTLLRDDAPFLPHLKGPKMKVFPSWYNQIPEGLEDLWASKNGKILVGTSASNTGNQVDLMWCLYRSKLVPEVRLTGNLGYGSIRYKYWVQMLGKLLFGQRWTGQLTRIPIEQYLPWLRSHSVLMMYNVRTQGTGTVVLALWFGLRVCLRFDCPFAQFLVHQGFAVTLLSSQTLNQQDLLPLQDSKRLRNRHRVTEVFGSQGVQSSYLNFVEEVRNGRVTRRSAIS
jgi:hypothetical protein